MSSKDNGRSAKSKTATASASHSKSPNTTPGDDAGATPTANPPTARGGKRVKEDQDEHERPPEDKKKTSSRKSKAATTTASAPEPASEVEKDEDGSGGSGDDESGPTRCICELDDNDEGGVMVMCDDCRVWQHTACMQVPEDAIPENYFCEQCRPDLHQDLLRRLRLNKVRRPRRRSSATRILTRDLSPSPQPNSAMLQKPKSPKRRSTMNSRDAAYDEMLALQAAKQETRDDDEEENIPIVYVGPKPRKRKRSAAASVPDPDAAAPPAKRPRSNSVTSEQRPAAAAEPPAPISEEPLEPAPEHHSDEEPTPAPAPPPRGKRGAGAKKGAKAVKAPSPLPEAETEETPARPPPKAGKQPNQYSHRKGAAHSPVKRGTAATNNTHETNKRSTASNNNNSKESNKNTRASSPAGLLTTWHLPEHLQHLKDILPSDIPKPLDVRTGPGVETTQERGVKVKWPTKRMTIGDMNKRVRNLFEYITREQSQLAERQSRVEALDTALKEERYKPVVMQKAAMEVDNFASMEEDIKPEIEKEQEPNEGNEGPRTRSSVAAAQPVDPNNPIVQWCSLSTEEMLEDLLSEVLAFQDKYRPKAKRHNGVVA